MRLYFCSSVRRMISVGWAVSTSSMRRPQTASIERVGRQPAARSRGSASSIDAGCGRRRARAIGAAAADAVVLLGDVGQIEEVREARATGSAASTGIARSSPASVSKSSSPAAVRALRERAHPLDPLEQRLALVAAQRVAQQLAEQPHVVAKRLVRIAVIAPRANRYRAIVPAETRHRCAAIHHAMHDAHTHSAVVAAEGHLIDSHILTAIFDTVIERGGAFEVLHFEIGRTNDDFSRISLKVSAPSAAALRRLVEDLIPLGCRSGRGEGRAAARRRPRRLRAGRLLLHDQPADAVRVGGHWIDVERQRMDAVVVLEAAAPSAGSCAT